MFVCLFTMDDDNDDEGKKKSMFSFFKLCLSFICLNCNINQVT